MNDRSTNNDSPCRDEADTPKSDPEAPLAESTEQSESDNTLLDPVIRSHSGSAAGSISEGSSNLASLLFEKSKSTMLSWWHDEEIECIACGNQENNMLEEQERKVDSVSSQPSRLAEVSADDIVSTMEQIKLGVALERQLEQINKETKESKSNDSRSSSTQCSSNSSDGDNISTLVNHHHPTTPKGLSWRDRWSAFVGRLGGMIASAVTALAMVAARNPYICIISTLVVSFCTLAFGAYWNFTLEVDNSELWPPSASASVTHMNWLYYESQFNYDYRFIELLVHANGKNVLTQDGVDHVFQAMSIIQNSQDYQQGCDWADLVGDANQVGECHIHSISQFWNNSQATFQEDVESGANITSVMSAEHFPSGEAVDLSRIIGSPEFDDDGILLTAQSFLVKFDLPWSYETEDFELNALAALRSIQDDWKADDGNIYRLEIVAYRSYEDEFMRAILYDLPLLPAVFAVMCLFCCLVFWRKDKIQSRCLLGICAVVCIGLSIMTSFGLMFILGVPFTTNTSMLPFLMFGIGLDDSFIIIGSYTRTQGQDTLQRIRFTMRDIGLSIFITSFTSTLAFTMGCFSDIPAVQWLCLYAVPSVVIDFVYQITFFVALLVLDERRIQNRRMDCCVCIQVTTDEDNNDNDKSATESTVKSGQTLEQTPIMIQLTPDSERHWADQFMSWYADILLRPTVQMCVLVAYTGLLIGSIYAASTLTQYFDLNDMVPHDSYMRGYYDSLETFAPRRNGISSYAFFRNVDQADPEVQQQMLEFVDDLAENGAIAGRPVNFWLRDFLEYSNTTELSANLTFAEQIESFLQVPLYNDIYDDHIIRNPQTGEVIRSRVKIYVDVDLAEASDGIATLELLRDVASEQSINENVDRGAYKFFTYQDMYNLWEFYTTVVEELRLSTFIGIVSVSLVGLVLIPHWTAVLFITPMIISLYVCMLGYINYAKIYVNAISYVIVIMSIGLMVDYLVHVLMRYYECEGSRRERVKQTLETMGASIFVGGLSSLTGVFLLIFSTSEILNMVFIAVFGLVILGILHGLVFLPVILSLIGPESPKAAVSRPLQSLASF